jgi:hypothetical protein
MSEWRHQAQQVNACPVKAAKPKRTLHTSPKANATPPSKVKNQRAVKARGGLDGGMAETHIWQMIGECLENDFPNTQTPTKAPHETPTE